jgi:FkbM family methyltransferase
MGIIDHVPPGAVRWLGRQQFRPLIGPLVSASARWVRRKPRVVAHGQAKGLLIDPSGTHPGYALGTSEPMVQDVFAENISPGGVVWDIGANVGFFSMIASRLVGDGKVVAFEPLPANQEAMRRNLTLNGITNVQLVDLAVGDQEGTAYLQLCDSPARPDTRPRLLKDDDPSPQQSPSQTRQLEVQTSTIDRQLETLPAPSLVKMDIEGSEVAALQGASVLLSKHRPTVICEFHGTNRPVTDLLESYGYRVQTLENPEIPPRDAHRKAHVLAIPGPASQPA